MKFPSFFSPTCIGIPYEDTMGSLVVIPSEDIPQEDTYLLLLLLEIMATED